MTNVTRGEAKAGLFARGQKPVPLLGVEVRAEIVAGHSRATVRQRYRNDEARPIEAIYTFPLPSRGALVGFAMTVNGRRLEGEVHEREEAFERYDEALSAGHGAALLEQERPNVFTANVGNLLPGEETVVEIELVEPIQTDEGAIRWSLPTLVAPRYMPGAISGDRTGHGAAEPTTRVPDADRISPPIGSVAYGLSLELDFDVGCEVDVESPSHAIVAQRVSGKTRVTFAQREALLDRDVVVTAVPKEAADRTAPFASVVAHRSAERAAFALTIVPDLAGSLARRDTKMNVVFLLDRSGSMDGASIVEAKTALKLCLRQLREGDELSILAFDDRVEELSKRPMTRSTLAQADAWIEAIDARGGTEMLEPLERAVAIAPDGLIVLLTDGQVGNEEEIQRVVLERRKTARVHSFGIGTNVSDALLGALADETGGAVEMIHPGERVDEKVVAQFARATAPRVTDLSIRFRGVEVGEIAPAKPLALVDGEPFTVFGTYEQAGRGVVEIRGTCDGEALYLEVPFDLPEREDRPAIVALWAQARIRDLEHAQLSGRRAGAMKDRIVKLAKEHRVSSRYTSFVVVEKRTGDRRVNEQAEARVVPVSAPAGWAMFNRRMQTRAGSVRACAMPMMMPAAPLPPARMMSPRSAPPVAKGARMVSSGPPPPPAAVASPTRALESTPIDPAVAILERQSASGLWSDEVDATIEALLALFREGLSTAHAVHGAQIRKGVEALVAAIEARPIDVKIAERGLAVAWLLATGRRTKAAIEEAARRRADLGALSAAFSSSTSRAAVERAAGVC
ncbi:MAG: VWA domain-containing protein [Labilithrix sp.]|nr:VWA domain-containing protein [Labilithrix sp.]